MLRSLPPSGGLSRLPRARLARMDAARVELFEVLELFAKAGQHPVRALLDQSDEAFTRYARYPQDSAGEAEDLCSWYYHAHDPSPTRPWEEHGHFHCFAYTELVREGAVPLALPEGVTRSEGGLIHLLGLSVKQDGTPMRIFTLNRWASNEWLYPARDIIPLIDKFETPRDKRFALTGRWLSALLKVTQPQIAEALLAREELLMARRADDPEGFAEDRSIDIASTLEFDLDAHLDELDRALRAKKRAKQSTTTRPKKQMRPAIHRQDVRMRTRA